MLQRLALIAILAFGTAFTIAKISTVNYEKASNTEFKKKNIIRCGPNWEALNDWLEETSIPPIPGSGNHRWKISTKNDSAQFYFNQGINMYYSFHIIEAMASFKKAAKFDPNCAMLYWAQALAYGPNINDVGYSASNEAFLAAGRAIESCGSCSEKEEMLIKAQRFRYTGDSAEDRKALNQVYADQMKKVYEKFPNDVDVATLYADALMLQHPWDLWNTDGTPKPWTPLIREVLEKILAKNPNHPGAVHYYIHVMEPSPYAAKALPYADRLGKITPGLSHTVHMPSHIYLRTGNYDKGVSVNEAAVKSYKRAISLYAPVTGNDFLYIIHNLHMQTNNAMLAGRSAYSEKSAMETVNSIPKEYLSLPGAMGNYMQYLYMTPTLVYVRFGKWEKLLNAQQPDKNLVYANLLYHFGKGMALANTSKIEAAKQELVQIQSLLTDTVLALPLTPFSPALDGATIASKLLAGTIGLREGKFNDAIIDFSKAVEVEQNMVYNEPRDWMLNPKPYLGYAQLKDNDAYNAEKTFRADLKNNNENGWSLYGLYQSLHAQKKISETKKVWDRYKKAFIKSDIKLSTPVY